MRALGFKHFPDLLTSHKANISEVIKIISYLGWTDELI